MPSFACSITIAQAYEGRHSGTCANWASACGQVTILIGSKSSARRALSWQRHASADARPREKEGLLMS